MFNIQQCPYRIWFFNHPFDFGYKCSKLKHKIVQCPQPGTFDQSVPNECPMVKLTVTDNTGEINGQ